MAQIICKGCGQMISDQVNYCPYCGCLTNDGVAVERKEEATENDTPKEKSDRTKLLLVSLVAILAIALGIGIWHSMKGPEDKLITISLSGYMENEKLQHWEGNCDAKHYTFSHGSSYFLETKSFTIPEGKVWILKDYEFRNSSIFQDDVRIVYNSEEYYRYRNAEKEIKKNGRSIRDMDRGATFFSGQSFYIVIYQSFADRDRTPFSLEINFIERKE